MKNSPALLLSSRPRNCARVADNFLNTTDRGVASSNLACSTIQSFISRPSRRIARNPHVCARFAVAHGPGEGHWAALIGGTLQNLSGLDSAGSTDVRSHFAFTDRTEALSGPGGIRTMLKPRGICRHSPGLC